MTNPLLQGFSDELTKLAREKVHFREKAVPAKAKKIYTAMKRDMPELKRRYGSRAKEVAARTALKQGKK